MVTIATYAEPHFDGVDRLWREAFSDDAPRLTARRSIFRSSRQTLLSCRFTSGSAIWSSRGSALAKGCLTVARLKHLEDRQRQHGLS
jgi:hypothetical protein